MQNSVYQHSPCSECHISTNIIHIYINCFIHNIYWVGIALLALYHLICLHRVHDQVNAWGVLTDHQREKWEWREDIKPLGCPPVRLPLDIGHYFSKRNVFSETLLFPGSGNLSMIMSLSLATTSLWYPSFLWGFPILG